MLVYFFHFFFSADFKRFYIKIFFFLFCICPFVNRAFAQTSSEGSLRLRVSLPEIQNQHFNPFLIKGQLYFTGSYYPANNWKGQIHFISSNPYKKQLSLKNIMGIYPSIQWLISKNLDLKLGRIFYENKFPQIISLNKYEDFFYTFDGAFLDYNTKILNINFWGAALPKRWIGKNQLQEFKYGFGFFLDVKSISNYIDYFNAHAAYLVDSLFIEDAKKTSRYGVGLKGSIKPINLSYTFVAVGHGEGIKFTSKQKMYHILLDYSYPDLLDSAISAGYHKDSSKYNPWLYDRHNTAGFLDLFLWGNLNYFFVNLKTSPMDLLTIKLSFYNLTSTEEGFIQKGHFGSFFKPTENSFLVRASQDLGQELDFQIQKLFKNQFEIHLLAGLFFPSSVLQKSLFPKSIYNNIQLTGLYKF